jgi:16S rRNA G966 N2-methylase RsmD
VERAAERLTGPYDLVLADPPYGDTAAVEALERIAASSLIGADATLVYEHAERDEPPPGFGTLSLVSTRRYGDTRVSIYHR